MDSVPATAKDALACKGMDGDGRSRHVGTDRKADAAAWLTEQSTKIATGQWVLKLAGSRSAVLYTSWSASSHLDRNGGNPLACGTIMSAASGTVAVVDERRRSVHGR